MWRSSYFVCLPGNCNYESSAHSKKKKKPNKRETHLFRAKSLLSKYVLWREGAAFMDTYQNSLPSPKVLQIPLRFGTCWAYSFLSRSWLSLCSFPSLYGNLLEAERVYIWTCGAVIYINCSLSECFPQEALPLRDVHRCIQHSQRRYAALWRFHVSCATIRFVMLEGISLSGTATLERETTYAGNANTCHYRY